MSLGLLTIFSVDYGSLFPAACMSSNFYYILDIVDNVTRSLDFLLSFALSRYEGSFLPFGKSEVFCQRSVGAL